MSTIEDVNLLQKEGKTEDEIRDSLEKKGIPSSIIEQAINQSKIKDAVSQNDNEYDSKSQKTTMKKQGNLIEETQNASETYNPPQTISEEEYQPSEQLYQPRQQPQQENQEPEPAIPSPYSQQYQPQDYSGSPEQQYQYQQQYASSPGFSSDTVSEISEQIFDEKISLIKREVDKLSDLKSGVLTKIDYLDERLKRIEKTIDRLQLSVLQKVGDYVTNVEDIKKEIVETQKTFKAMHQSRK